MNARLPIIVAATLLCAGTAIAVFLQHGRLTTLRAERQQLLTDAAVAPDTSSSTATESAAQPTVEKDSPASSSTELLRLRNQVGQLTRRQRDLAAARTENERLRSQLAAKGTNAATGVALPPGYISRRDAQWVGLSSPENSLQSMLSALRNRDWNSLLLCLTSEAGEEIKKEFGDSPERFFDSAGQLPGMRIISQERMPDGSIEAQIEIIPGGPEKGPMQFRLIDGQWRIAPK